MAEDALTQTTKAMSCNNNKRYIFSSIQIHLHPLIQTKEYSLVKNHPPVVH